MMDLSHRIISKLTQWCT